MLKRKHLRGSIKKYVENAPLLNVFLKKTVLMYYIMHKQLFNEIQIFIELIEHFCYMT